MWERSPGAWVDPACPIEWGCPQTRGLVGMWAAPPNSGWWGGERLRDLTRGARQPKDGILSGMGTSTTSGWVGLPSGLHALAFDGSNDEVNCGANVVYDTTAVTMCAWVRPAAFPNSYNAVFSRTNAINSYKQILVKSTGKLAIYTERAYYDGTGTNTLAAGTTYFLAFTYDSVAGLTGYINGVVDGTAAAGGTLDTTAGLSLYLGRDSGVAGRIWQGLIWDALLFNRALSAAEVRWWYQQGRDGYRDAWRWASSRAYSLPAVASGDIAGTAALAFAAGSSTLTGAGALAGASALVFDDGSSVLVGAGALAGASALVFGAGSSTILGAGALVGSSALMFAAGSSTLAGAGALAGAAALVFGAGNSVLGGPGDMVGSAALAFGAGSSTLVGAGTLAGSSSLAFTEGFSTLVGEGVLIGSSAITFDDGTSTLLGAGALTGQSDLVFGAGSSVLSGPGDSVGSAAIVFGAGSSTLVGAGALAGSSAIVFDDGASTLVGSGVLAGQADVLFGAGSTALTGSGALAGASALAFDDGSSALTGAGALAGSSALIFTPSGTLDVPSGVLTGSASLSFLLSGTTLGAGALAGSSALNFGAGSSVASGSGALAGALAIQISATGVLTVVDNGRPIYLTSRDDTTIALNSRDDTTIALTSRDDTTLELTGSSTMSITKAIEMFRGEDLTLNFTMDPVEDISGLTIQLGVRKKTGTTFLFTKTATITDGPAGEYSISVAHADTKDLTPGEYYYSVRRQPAGQKAELSDGPLLIKLGAVV